MRRLTAVFLAAAIATVATAGAGFGYTSGSDVVLFFDHCDRGLYAINSDGSGRRALPDVGDGWPLDVTRDPGSVTVLSTGYRNPADPSSDWTMYAIDPSGQQAPVDLLPPGAPARNGLGVFSPGETASPTSMGRSTRPRAWSPRSSSISAMSCATR